MIQNLRKGGGDVNLSALRNACTGEKKNMRHQQKRKYGLTVTNLSSRGKGGGGGCGGGRGGALLALRTGGKTFEFKR